jgi:trigger factor
MKIEKKDLDKSQIELKVELSPEEFRPYIDKGAVKVSKELKIDGFRPGKVPYEVLKKKIGEMTILEEAARLAINKTLSEAIKDNIESQPVGEPKIEVVKLAPDNPLIYKIVIAVLPEVKLGEYKNLNIKQKQIKIEKEEIDKILSDLVETRVKEIVVDEPIKEGYKTIVDIEMFLDNVPIEGGQGRDTAVIVGRNYIVPGFDKNLLGARKGEERRFSLLYPKDYHMKNLAGKMVDFKVKVKEIYRRDLPKLDDQFAQGFGLRRIDELKENIKKTLETNKEREASQAAEREMLEKIMNKAKFGDLPELLVEHEAKVMMDELEQTVAREGGKFEDYLSSLGKTRDQLTLDLLPEAVKRVKISLLVRQLAKEEKIKVSSEEVENYIREMKQFYRSQSAESGEAKEMLSRLEKNDFKNYILNVLTSRKVIDKLREWNIKK